MNHKAGNLWLPSVSVVVIAILGQLILTREIATASIPSWTAVTGVPKPMIADAALSKRSSLLVVKSEFSKCMSCPKARNFEDGEEKPMKRSDGRGNLGP